MMISTLETALNRILLLDPQSLSRLSLLQDKIVTIELLGLPLKWQMIFTSEKVIVATKNFLTPHTLIQGAPVSLLHLALAKEARKNLFGEHASIQGDLEVGEQVIALFDELEIDWEEQLSHWIGDIPAHQSGRLAKKLGMLAQRTRQSFTGYINEYIHEEANWFPTREALQDFFSDIDELRMQVDRIEARIKIIEDDK